MKRDPWDSAPVLATGRYEGRHAAIREVDGEVVLFGGETGIVQSMRPGAATLGACVETLRSYLDGAA